MANGKVTLLFSQELLTEFVEVTQRSKFRKYFNAADLDALLLKIKGRANYISVKSKVTACRDAKDNFLLALAVDGKATHHITGDKDLLILKHYRKTKIVSITEYLAGVGKE
jgi:putative PIN family toxin of toxin-antitoxin system